MAGTKEYDYIIVGAGSAGCMLAYRLGANPDNRILILEAGGPDTDPLIHIPLGLGKMHEKRAFNLFLCVCKNNFKPLIYIK